MNNSVFTIFAVFLVSLVAFLGVLVLFVRQKNLKKFTAFLVSLASGTLLGDTFFHLLPELYEIEDFLNWIPFGILSGVIVFYIMETILHWHHCHKTKASEHTHPVALNNLVADALHNFLDGVIIASGFLVSTEIGLATTIAVFLHEIPQEIGDFGILIHSGMKPKKALFLNFISALFAIFGASLVLIFGDNILKISNFMLAFGAGSFLYIAMSDLLPEIKKELSLKKASIQLLIMLIGIFVMYVLTFLE